MNLRKIAEVQVDALNAWQTLYSLDGKWLAVIGQNGPAYLVDASYKKPVMLRSDASDSYGYSCGAFSPNNRLLALGKGRNIEIWQIAPLRRIKEFPAHKNQMDTLLFSPAGNRLLSMAVFGRETFLWSTHDWIKVQDFPNSASVQQGATFSPDGRRLYLTTKPRGQLRRLRLWQEQGGGWKEESVDSPLVSKPIWRIGYSYSGALLFTVADKADRDPKILRQVGGVDQVIVWNKNRQALAVTTPGIAGYLSVSQGDSLIAVGSNINATNKGGESSLNIWEIKSGHMVGEYRYEGFNLPCLAFSPTRMELACGIGPGAKEKTVTIYQF